MHFDSSFEWDNKVEWVVVRLHGKYAEFNFQDISRRYWASGEHIPQLLKLFWKCLSVVKCRIDCVIGWRTVVLFKLFNWNSLTNLQTHATKKGGYVFKEAVMLETAHARSDEGLRLEMSTLEALYGGLLALLTQLIEPNYLLIQWLTHWLSDWAALWMTDWVSPWLDSWLNIWLTDRLTDSLTRSHNCTARISSKNKETAPSNRFF